MFAVYKSEEPKPLGLLDEKKILLPAASIFTPVTEYFKLFNPSDMVSHPSSAFFLFKRYDLRIFLFSSFGFVSVTVILNHSPVGSI